MKISVIVTNWNGLKLLKKNFEQVIHASPEAEEIILADDASEDGSLEYIKSLQSKYPKIKIISHKKNLGFGDNSNIAIKQTIGDLVVLLNNDLFPHFHYITPALLHFKKPDTFGVGFSELNHENYANIFWKNGYIQYSRGISNKTHISGWVSGGSSIVRKNIFLKLGGFDPVYAPFYSEDLDLGYRAWKSGYRCLWEPKCTVEHRHESTMSKFPKNDLDYIKERNRLLTVWRNIDNPKLLLDNKISLFLRVLTGPNYIKIISSAIRQLKKFPPPTVFPKMSDKDIFALFKND